jgi:hypothetical protein
LLFSIVVDFPWFGDVEGLTWLMPVASIVALVFLKQVPGTTQREEHGDIGQQPHDDVEADDAADSDADEFGDLVLGVSIH